MPVYNGLPLIKASIESLLNQTYDNWECIIVDDGSIDGTSEYLYSLHDPHFIIHHFSSNQGRPAARQKTLDLATGDYIAILDAGDLYASNSLELLLTKIQEHPEVSLVSASMCSFGTTTTLLRKRGADKEQVMKFDDLSFPNHASSMLQAARAKRFKYNPLMKLGQDKDFLERYLAKTSWLAIPDIVYYYSEFDSVNKKKIRHSYRLIIVNNFKKRQHIKMLKYIAKYIYSLIIFPFIPTTTIIKRRGRPLREEEKVTYYKECKKIWEKYL